MTMYKHECRGEGGLLIRAVLGMVQKPREMDRQTDRYNEREKHCQCCSAGHISRLAASGPSLRAASQQILLTDHLKIDGVPLFHIFLSQLPDRPEGQNKALGRIMRSCKKVTFLELPKKTNDNACRNLCSFLSIKQHVCYAWTLLVMLIMMYIPLQWRPAQSPLHLYCSKASHTPNGIWDAP